jgi:dihydropteroate synthase
VLPIVTALSAAGVPVSIDTMRASVAVAALERGAVLVNDVSGGLADPAMLPLVAERRCTYVAMHWRGPSTVMEQLTQYDDVVRDVRAELGARLQAAVAAGVDPAFVVVDPGLGFAKEAYHNWRLLARLDVLAGLGRPLLVGASRKRFLGTLLADSDGVPPPTVDRDAATAAVSALASAAGVWCVRVHDPAGSLAAVHVGAAWHAGGG